jgi:hypothetical protein
LGCLSCLLAAALVSPRAAAALSSTFSSDTEEWTVVNWDGTGTPVLPSWSSTAGHPGGCIRSGDVHSDGFWRAPAAFHGNWSAAYGHALSYDWASFIAADWKMNDIYIQGNGQTLSYWHPTNATVLWATVSVSLDTNGGWQYGLNYDTIGTLATEAQIRSVLSNVTDVRIRQEFVFGSDDSALDNVTVDALISTPLPNPQFGAVKLTNGVMVLPLQNLQPQQTYQLERTSPLAATNVWLFVTQFTATNVSQTLTLPATNNAEFFRAKSL